jgi:hypothetical protein
MAGRCAKQHTLQYGYQPTSYRQNTRLDSNQRFLLPGHVRGGYLAVARVPSLSHSIAGMPNRDMKS